MIGDENQDGSTDMRYLLKNSDYEDIFKLIEENSNMNQDVISSLATKKSSNTGAGFRCRFPAALRCSITAISRRTSA